MRLMAASIFLSLMRPLGRGLMEMSVIFILLASLCGGTLESEPAIGIRLVNGPNNCSGRVEVFHRGSWGTICDNYWDIKDARIVCQQLGCGEARAAPGHAEFGTGTGKIWLDRVRCSGTESALSECPASEWGSNICHHEEDAGVICSGGTLDPDFPIRLVNGQSNCSGRIEVFYNGSWGTVCDNNWDIRDARVVCQQLGCGEARAAPGKAQFGTGTGTIWLDGAYCNGTESALSKCPAKRWGLHHCHHGKDAGVICSGTKLESETITWTRLVNGSNNCSGRVEVFFNGSWGSVCDNNWDIKDARVVCQEMGCGAAIEAVHYALFGRGTGPIFVDSLFCNGKESILRQCDARRWGGSDCNHGQDAGVICSGGTLDSDFAIRLVNGHNNCSGRVEVFHDGQWGTICDDNWDIRDAKVICQQMDCGFVRKAPGGAYFGPGTGPIWLDGIHCTGRESTLSECPADQWGSHNCRHGEDASVVCSGATLESNTSLGIQLVNGRSNCSGRVEVFHDGQWGTVCDDNWDIIDARIVCKEMGCGQARLAPSGYVFGRGTGPIWLDDVECTGTESTLSQCPAKAWGENNCNHGEDVAVFCEDTEPHRSRLTLWLPALCVFLATALLVFGGIIWYFTSKWKGSQRYEVPLEARNVIDGDM